MSAEWKPSVTSAHERRQRWNDRGPVHIQSYTVRGVRGVARKFENGHESIEKCGHVHHKRTAALTCAEALAKSLNKSLDNPA